MKEFNGKAIYNPSGKAKEYSYWACNTHVGCLHECSYCYLKKGRGAKILGGNKPRLKKCFNDLDHAIQIFIKELEKNLDEIKKHGLFFSFTTDPFITYIGGDESPFNFTKYAVGICSSYKVPVKLLTKCGGNGLIARIKEAKMMEYWDIDFVSIGFSLTGHDELEPNADSNEDRIYAMKDLSLRGYKTFASIEPIIDAKKSFEMIEKSINYCDLYKIGLSSPNVISKEDAFDLKTRVDKLIKGTNVKVYWKESIINLLNLDKNALGPNSVPRDYKMHK